MQIDSDEAEEDDADAEASERGGAPTRTTSDRLACLFLSPAVAAAIGLVEWALAGLGRGMPQADAARALATVVLLYTALGVPCGLVCSALAHRLRAPRAAAVCSPAVLIAVVVAAVGSGSPLGALAALALGWFALRAAILVASRVAPLSSLGLWWVPVTLALAAGVGLSALEAPDALGLAAAFSGALLGAVALGLAALRRVWWPLVGGSAIAFAAAGWLGWRATPPDSVATVEPGRPSVLLVTIDTLRADHVGAYGHAAAHTPAMDGLAAEGTLFRTAVTQSVVTGPSHTSILTGKLPGQHGVLANETRLRNDVPTIAEVLGRNGYATGAFVGGLTVSDRSCGLPSRFGEFDDWFVTRPWFAREVDRSVALARSLRKLFDRAGLHVLGFERPAAATVELASAWLERQGDRPFFAWVHMYDPHLPYQAPSSYLPAEKRAYTGPAQGEWYLIPSGRRTAIADSPAAMQRMLDLYDAEIAYSDEQLGRLVAVARAAAPEGNLLVVVTSDHGESMGEHDLYWYRDLYDPTLLVPLIVVPPVSAGDLRRVVSEQVRLIDLAPTILEVAGLGNDPIVAGMDGASLLPLMQIVRSKADVAPRPAYTAIHAEPANYIPERFAVRHLGWKLIQRLPGWQRRLFLPRVRETRELYHLDDDPAEAFNVVDREPPVLAQLEAELAARATVVEPAPKSELTPEERDQLRTLGYVE